MPSGHTAVVPVDGQDWHTDPFAPETRDDRLYGRGTADMKSFLGVISTGCPQRPGQLDRGSGVGKLAHRVGPLRIMLTAAVATLVLAVPLFMVLVANPSILTLTLVQIVLGVLMAFYFGPLPALLTSMYSTEIRTTGLSISYNLGVTLFGGFAPIILTWLISSSGSLLSPSYYLITVAAISLIGMLVIRSRRYVDR